MLSQQELQQKLRQTLESEDDVFGFRSQVFISYLDYDHAREFLKEEVTKEKFGPPSPVAHAYSDMEAYAEFAWEKIQNHRGLSASRNLDKMWAWSHVVGREDIADYIDEHMDIDYAQYGAPIMAYVSEQMGFDIPNDPGVQRMIQGLPCRDDCDEGCGQ